MRLISRGKRKRYWQIVQFSERRELHFLQNYLYSFRLLEKKREIACGTTGDSLVYFVWKRYFQLCVNKNQLNLYPFYLHIAYTGLVEDETRTTAQKSFLLHYFLEKRRIFNRLIFCIQISLRMFLKFEDIT